jgi:hypothetical protein
MQATDLGEARSDPRSERRRRTEAEAPSGGWVQLAIGLLICVVLLAVGLWSLKHSPQSKIGPYGLIQALNHAYYVVIVALLLSLAWTLRVRRFRPLLMSAHLIVLVILIQGAPAVIESEPRFATAWLTAGFTNYVEVTGKFLPKIDARFSWPSFFAGSALLDSAAGLKTAVSLIRWWPVVLNFLYLPLIFRLAHAFLRSDDKAWIATALFPLANWVGQDYYSPQSIAFLLYLAFLYLLVGPLGADDHPMWFFYTRRQRRVLKMGRPWLAGDQLTLDQRAQQRSSAVGFQLCAVVLLMAAMASGHQLTPIVATGSALMLVLVGRTRVRWLIFFFGLMTVAWICYGADSFWSGHFGLIFGGVGSVQGNVGNAVIARLHGAAAHLFVVDVRSIMSVVVWILALLGAIFWRKGGADRRGALAGFLLPFGLLAGGSYGGEAVLRVYLFALPFALCLVAALLSRLRLAWGQVATGLVLVILLPFFLVSRWGNELFELVRPNEIKGVEALYRMAKPGSTLIAITPQLPWRFADIQQFHYRPTPLTQSPLELILLAESNPKNTYVIITTSQVVYGWQDYGLSRNWGAKVESQLDHSPYFKLRYKNPDTQIFQYVPPQRP